MSKESKESKLFPWSLVESHEKGYVLPEETAPSTKFEWGTFRLKLKLKVIGFKIFCLRKICRKGS